MSEMSKDDVVRVLVKLDTMAAGSASPKRRAWAHLFIALGLIQKEMPDPEMLTRARFMELAGKVHDRVYSALASGEGPQA